MAFDISSRAFLFFILTVDNENASHCTRYMSYIIIFTHELEHFCHFPRHALHTLSFFIDGDGCQRWLGLTCEKAIVSRWLCNTRILFMHQRKCVLCAVFKIVIAILHRAFKLTASKCHLPHSFAQPHALLNICQMI